MKNVFYYFFKRIFGDRYVSEPVSPSEAFGLGNGFISRVLKKSTYMLQKISKCPRKRNMTPLNSTNKLLKHDPKYKCIYWDIYLDIIIITYVLHQSFVNILQIIKSNNNINIIIILQISFHSNHTCTLILVVFIIIWTFEWIYLEI